MTASTTSNDSMNDALSQTKKFLIVTCWNDIKGRIEVFRETTTMDEVRSLIVDEFDDDMLPEADWAFVVDGIRLTTKQESKQLALPILHSDVRIESKTKQLKRPYDIQALNETSQEHNGVLDKPLITPADTTSFVTNNKRPKLSLEYQKKAGPDGSPNMKKKTKKRLSDTTHLLRNIEYANTTTSSSITSPSSKKNKRPELDYSSMSPEVMATKVAAEVARATAAADLLPQPQEKDTSMTIKDAISWLITQETKYVTQNEDLSASVSTHLVLEEDRKSLSKYGFWLMKQFRVCQFTEIDRHAKGCNTRENFPVGYGGFICIHCAAYPDARKFFFGGADKLQSNSSSIEGHVLQCRHCPQETKSALSTLKQCHSDDMTQIPRGSKKLFFERVWNRIHNNNNNKEDTVKVAGSVIKNPAGTPSVATSVHDTSNSRPKGESASKTPSKECTKQTIPLAGKAEGEGRNQKRVDDCVEKSNDTSSPTKEEKNESSGSSGDSTTTHKDDAISLLVAEERESSTNLSSSAAVVVNEEDQELLTDYMFFLMKQFRIIDNRGEGRERQNCHGFECIHCINDDSSSSDSAESGKFLVTMDDDSTDTLKAVQKSLNGVQRHIINSCRCCPQPVTDVLHQLEKCHKEQKVGLPHGWRKSLFERIRRRLLVHDDDDDDADDNEDECRPSCDTNYHKPSALIARGSTSNLPSGTSVSKTVMPLQVAKQENKSFDSSKKIKDEISPKKEDRAIKISPQKEDDMIKLDTAISKVNPILPCPTQRDAEKNSFSKLITMPKAEGKNKAARRRSLPKSARRRKPKPLKIKRFSGLSQQSSSSVVGKECMGSDRQQDLPQNAISEKPRRADEKVEDSSAKREDEVSDSTQVVKTGEKSDKAETLTVQAKEKEEKEQNSPSIEVPKVEESKKSDYDTLVAEPATTVAVSEPTAPTSTSGSPLNLKHLHRRLDLLYAVKKQKIEAVKPLVQLLVKPQSAGSVPKSSTVMTTGDPSKTTKEEPKAQRLLEATNKCKQLPQAAAASCSISSSMPQQQQQQQQPFAPSSTAPHGQMSYGAGAPPIPVPGGINPMMMPGMNPSAILPQQSQILIQQQIQLQQQRPQQYHLHQPQQQQQLQNYSEYYHYQQQQQHAHYQAQGQQYPYHYAYSYSCYPQSHYWR